MSDKVVFLADKVETLGGWSRRVQVGERQFHVSVRRGRSVRIPYKPRGQNRGWQWHGCVYEGNRCIWDGRVPSTIGCRGLLIDAGVL
jgi:hypothetical protein